jgi:hypothetical protein
MIERLAAKIDTVLERGYLEMESIKSHIDVFPVAKADDIRAVYNGSKSGLNEAVWAPSSFLPTSKSALQVMTYCSLCVDLDLREMNLNFALDEGIWPYAGVDISCLTPHLNNIPHGWEGGFIAHWNRSFMGFTPSPFNAVQTYYIGEEFARGNPAIENNPMRYNRVKLNLPFDSTCPRVMKWNANAKAIAGDVKTFVDDLRRTGYNFENSCQVAGQIGARFQYLGIQEAARKRRPPSQEPGAWTGAVFAIAKGILTKSVIQAN